MTFTKLFVPPPISPSSLLSPFFFGPSSTYLQFLSGAIFFPLLFISIRFFLGHASSSIVLRFRTSLAVRAVSSVQALLATSAAVAIMTSCGEDVVNAAHWSTKVYVRFCAAYFLYDIRAMYLAFAEESATPTWRRFLRRDYLIVLHHVFVLTILVPTVLASWRRDRGDYLVACFFIQEASTPFVALRAALHELGMSRTNLYFVNGLVMMSVFALCRILVFPYIYWTFSRHGISGVVLPIWRVPFAIPWHCNVVSAALFLLQFYWFVKMVKGAAKIIRNRKAATTENNNKIAMENKREANDQVFDRIFGKSSVGNVKME